jgi:hypothetical protein
MSAKGRKRTFCDCLPTMSAFGGKADIVGRGGPVKETPHDIYRCTVSAPKGPPKDPLTGAPMEPSWTSLNFSVLRRHYQHSNMFQLDTEDHELEVLEGATAVIDSARPFIILENWLHHGKPRLTLVPLTLLSARRYRFFLPGGYAETPIAF